MNTKGITMTRSEQQAQEKELELLKTVRRKEIAEKIKIARGFGDLSENSEYDAAKEEQAFIESRIIELERNLKNVYLIDTDNLTLEEVSVGVHVQLEGENGNVAEYDITGVTGDDPLNGKISEESPVGKGLLGKKVGEVADIQLPNGRTIQYKILAITKQGEDGKEEQK